MDGLEPNSELAGKHADNKSCMLLYVVVRAAANYLNWSLSVWSYDVVHVGLCHCSSMHAQSVLHPPTAAGACVAWQVRGGGSMMLMFLHFGMCLRHKADVC